MRSMFFPIAIFVFSLLFVAGTNKEEEGGGGGGGGRRHRNTGTKEDTDPKTKKAAQRPTQEQTESSTLQLKMAGRELARHRIDFRGPDELTKYWVIKLAETKRIGPCKTDAGIVSQRPGHPPHRHKIFAVPQKLDGKVKRWFLKVLPGSKTKKPGNRQGTGNMNPQLEDIQRETRACERSKQLIGKLRKGK